MTAKSSTTKPRVSRKAKPTVTIVHGTRNPRVTRVSRVHVEREHGVKLPKGVSAERAEGILLATGKFSGVEKITWSQAPAELRTLLSAIDDEGDEGEGDE